MGKEPSLEELIEMESEGICEATVDWNGFDLRIIAEGLFIASQY